ncbi:G2/mitotic-specific cyclin S13-7-like protein, partial [Tanacetum coccineum]
MECAKMMAVFHSLAKDDDKRKVIYRKYSKTLEMHTGFSEKQVMECAKMMAVFHSLAKDDDKRKVIYRKYSSISRGGVALYPPAKALLAA